MNENSATWTVNDLARLAAAALTAGSPTQPDARIREVPDVRTIRWYTSIGLLDRPAAMRGRTALYGRSHLAQLVAIKRLQARGLTVASVQERLLGADASAIEEIAMLPAGLDDLASPDLDSPDLASPADLHSPADHSPDLASPDLASPAVVDQPADPAAADEPAAAPAARSRFWAAPAAPRRAREPAAASAPIADVAAVVHGVRLAVDVTLLLPPGRLPDVADRAAIAEAARPLLDLLDRLGLSEPEA